MAKKKKTTKKKTKKASRSTEVKARTKSQIFGNISDKTGLTRKEVSGVFEEMATMIKKDLGRSGPGTFTVPGGGARRGLAPGHGVDPDGAADRDPPLASDERGRDPSRERADRSAGPPAAQ